MKIFFSLFVTTLLLTFSFQAEAQNKKSRVQPGRMYAPGDTLFAPRLGFTARVPEGWEGTLPRESEVFLLTSVTSSYGEMFVFGNASGELNSLKGKWENGVALSESVIMKAMNPLIKDGLLTSDVTADGYFVNKGYKAFAAARCNPSGPCIIALLFAPAQFIEANKTIATNFLQKGIFQEPSDSSPYENFDWKEFLSNKVVITYLSMQGGTKESEIHLCANGTFQSDIKKSGIFKNENPLYRGRNSGTWEVTEKGEQAVLKFLFKNKKLAPIEAPVLIDDEKIISNGERYYLGHSDKCK
jgi:hypothetical protein